MLKEYLQEIKKIKLLSLEEEQMLWKEIAQGNLNARSKLITSYQPLVFKTAMSLNLPQEQILELVQEGMVGLIEAVERYDIERGVAFSLFAVHRIRGRMIDYLRETSSNGVLCLDFPLYENVTLKDTLADCALGPEELAEENFLAGSVKQMLSRLPEKEQKVIEGLYIDQLTPAAIAESIAVSQSHIYRLKKKGVRRIRGMLSKLMHELKW